MKDMKTSSRKIIGIGETVLDIIFRDDDPSAAVPGGSTFNAMISLGRTVHRDFPDIQIVMVTETGDDHVGDIVVSFMEANGVETPAVIRRAGSQSPISLAFLDENNDAHYEFYKDPAHAELLPEKVESVHFQKDDIVLFGSFFAINPAIRDFTRSLLVAARRAGAIIYYDINFRPSHIGELPELMGNIEENCRLADFVRGSDEDFSYLLGGLSDGREIYEKHLRELCPNLILTRGADTVEIYTPESCFSFPVSRIETVSTIGAGDNFNAGFIYSLVAQGIMRDSANNLNLPDGVWTSLLGSATAFSSAVCRSIFNYVPAGYRP